MARNSQLDLTGLLIGTPEYFTQFLEGEQAALDRVMESIRADPRHFEIFETRTTSLFEMVQFPSWRMACFPPSSFVSRHLRPTLESKHGGISISDAAGLITFMRQIAPDLLASTSTG